MVSAKSGGVQGATRLLRPTGWSYDRIADPPMTYHVAYAAPLGTGVSYATGLDDCVRLGTGLHAGGPTASHSAPNGPKHT